MKDIKLKKKKQILKEVYAYAKKIEGNNPF